MTKRILFFRSGAIGDIIQCLPTIKLAKERNPKASIEFAIASPALKTLLEEYCPYIDKIHIVDKKPSKSKEFLVSLKTSPVDDFIYLHSNWWRAYFWNKKYIKAKKFYQYKKDIRFIAVENFAITYFPELKEQLLEAKKIDKQNACYKFLDYKTLDFVECLNTAPKYICMVIGVGNLRPNRAYPADHLKAVMKQVLEQTDFDIKMLGGADEKKLAEYLFLSLKGSLLENNSKEKVLALMARVENLVAKTDLKKIADVLSGSSQVFSGDTGILHIAAALDCDITSVFSITSEWRTGAFSPRAKVLRGDCSCKPDNSNSQKHCKNLKNAYASCLYKLDPVRVFGHLTSGSEKYVNI